MEQKKSQFGAEWKQGNKKDGTIYYYLSVGVYDSKGEYTELEKIFLDSLKKKVCRFCGIEYDGIKEEN